MSLKTRLQDWLGITQLHREQRLEIMLLKDEIKSLEVQLINQVLRMKQTPEPTSNPSEPNSQQTENDPGPDTFYDPHLGRF